MKSLGDELSYGSRRWSVTVEAYCDDKRRRERRRPGVALRIIRIGDDQDAARLQLCHSGVGQFIRLDVD